MSIGDALREVGEILVGSPTRGEFRQVDDTLIVRDHQAQEHYAQPLRRQLREIRTSEASPAGGLMVFGGGAGGVRPDGAAPGLGNATPGD